MSTASVTVAMGESPSTVRSPSSMKMAKSYASRIFPRPTSSSSARAVSVVFSVSRFVGAASSAASRASLHRASASVT